MTISISGAGLITNSSSAKSIDTYEMTKSPGGRYPRKVYAQTDSATYSFTTTWSVGPTFADIGDFKAGSYVLIDYHMPCRNDSASWGGIYIEPQVRFNSGVWQSLGSSGYDGGVMNSSSDSIGSYRNAILVDPGQSATFSVGVRFVCRSYDGTALINGSHEVNALSGTATLMSGTNGLQHYSKVIVQELALVGS